MSEVTEGLKVEASVDFENDAINVIGDAAYSLEAGDACLVVSAVYAVSVKVMAYTRSEVLEKLYHNMAIAARIGGVYSDAVAEFEADIEDVKNGGELAPHAWMFEVD